MSFALLSLSSSDVLLLVLSLIQFFRLRRMMSSRPMMFEEDSPSSSSLSSSSVDDEASSLRPTQWLTFLSFEEVLEGTKLSSMSDLILLLLSLSLPLLLLSRLSISFIFKSLFFSSSAVLLMSELECLEFSVSPENTTDDGFDGDGEEQGFEGYTRRQNEKRRRRELDTQSIQEEDNKKEGNTTWESNER